MTTKYPVQDFDAAANNSDFPQEWLRCLIWNLALEVAPEYGKEPTPFMVGMAEKTFFIAAGFDREPTSTFFQFDRTY
jgi:hypothetical protein